MHLVIRLTCSALITKCTCALSCPEEREAFEVCITMLHTNIRTLLKAPRPTAGICQRRYNVVWTLKYMPMHAHKHTHTYIHKHKITITRVCTNTHTQTQHTHTHTHTNHTGELKASMLQASVSANTLIVGSATDLVRAAAKPPQPGGKLADWILQVSVCL